MCIRDRVNTGWTGGSYGVGERFPIPVTRAIINAIQDNKINTDDVEHLEKLNLNVPKDIKGVNQELLNPRNCWESVENYDEECDKLCMRFKENFRKFDVGQQIIDAGPR